ncbi:hypothetical protein PF005_g12845 [Phytophthora fragariae]|uniref:Reverse transcriptase Ty1/copia-type domain-containing protein n=2 Tax=Phytophthora TaxID=4783 RepID=A0A6A3TWM5_9STRA|nr:hypothetical protein PF003_g8208 [Phytophthora fragariae]KAE8935641.1 hypothetical protein PF009_g14420 [Phytophthora fragariae]KAE9005895.1 hypothetical protein PF011_g11834 [Phytophthora fragariae]KAE9105982.1 hypothetical protein PF010_g12793 [Phytophthora fragariae]KAE9106350.1 hypothetical protein PF007_g13429 [Phytophthora fragariae]
MRVLRYLHGTADYGLVMDVRASSTFSLVGYSDADYANDPDDYKSVSGYVTLLDGNVVSYASRKQSINAQSTCEAEYIAMNECTRDLLWFEGLLDELLWKHDLPVLRGDNMGSIRLASKPGKHRNTKHIMNKFHLVRHLVEKKCLRTEHVGTEDQIADVMTKALGTVKFRRFRTALKVLQVIPGRDVTSGTAQPDTI